MAGEAEVRDGERAEEEEEGGVTAEADSIPEQNGGDNGGEKEGSDEEKDIVNFY